MRPHALVLPALLAATALAAPDPAVLTRVTPQQALKLANTWRGEGGLRSYVTSEAVHFTFQGGRTVAVPLPEDRMVIAIAPYLDRTHPCKTHFTSSCSGELKNTPVNVHVTEGGKTVLRKTVKTLDNGFLEVWLPRGRTYDVTLSANGKRATGTLGTLPGADTCVTTLQLR